MPVADALREGTIQWRAARREGADHELLADGEVVGRAGPGRIQVDEVTLRLRPQREQVVLVDEARENRVAVLRRLASGPAAMSVGAGRYRLSRTGVLPIRWHVTIDVGGPEVLRILRVPGRLLLRAGDALDTPSPAELGLVVAATSVLMLDLQPDAAPSPFPTVEAAS